MTQKGFTLVEALISLAILGIVLAGLVPAFTHYARLNTDSELRSSAVAVAQQVMEELRQLELSRWPDSEETWSLDMGDRNFEVLIEHDDWDDDGESSAKEVYLQVSHNDRMLYEVETVYTQLN